MAKDKEPTLYERMRDALGEIQSYEQGLEEAKKAVQTSQAAIGAAARESEEAAIALQKDDNSQHKLNFIAAGLDDSVKGFETDFIKNRGNLEGLLGDKDVQETLPNAIWAYKPTAAKGYEAAVKLHNAIAPMRENIQKFQEESLSKSDEQGVFAGMATEVIGDYAKKYAKKPLWLRAFVALAGGTTDKDGKVKVGKDKKPVVVEDQSINKNFTIMKYNSMLQEKLKEFSELIGDNLPAYVAATLPANYKDSKNFYSTVAGMIESKKQKKK